MTPLEQYVVDMSTCPRLMLPSIGWNFISVYNSSWLCRLENVTIDSSDIVVSSKLVNKSAPVLNQTMGTTKARRQGKETLYAKLLHDSSGHCVLSRSCAPQESPHHKIHAGVPKWRLRGGAWKRPRKERLPPETRNRNLLYSAIPPTEGITLSRFHTVALCAEGCIFNIPLSPEQEGNG